MTKATLLALAILLPFGLPAQTPEPDEEGCKDSTIISRVPGCRISECSKKAFDSAELTIGRIGDEAKSKTVEGETDVNQYECVGSVSLLQIARNAEGALRKAGFTIVYTGKSPREEAPMVTGQTGGRWVEVRTWDNGGPIFKRL